MYVQGSIIKVYPSVDRLKIRKKKAAEINKENASKEVLQILN